MDFPTSSRAQQPPGPAATITCVDCGGIAYLLTTFRPDEPPEPGDIVVYRCGECDDRWDLIVAEEDME